MAEFVIIFREVLEAGLIVGILYTYLNKVNQQSSILKMWQGVIDLKVRLKNYLRVL